MDQTVEPEIAPATIEATLNYVVNGAKDFHLHGEPGSNDNKPVARVIRTR